MKILLALIVFMITISGIHAQENRIHVEYKKGEVLDIILATTKPGTDKENERYRKTAFPIAFEYSYKRMPVFSISDTQFGLFAPSLFIFGKWNNIEKREGFLDNIVTRLPDFHEQRRNLFSYFVLTYYELEKDVSFYINKEKYNISTSFWKKDEKSYTTFLNSWKDKIKEFGGKIILELKDGNSPTGYYYNPDSVILVEWETEKAFEEFLSITPLSEYEVLENVHQFRIE